jgi:hypothetical protein
MKNDMFRRRVRFFPALCFLTVFSLFITACPTEAEDDDTAGDNEVVITETGGGVRTLEFTVPADGVRYFNLGAGEEVTDQARIKSADWDIAFQESRFAYTNSGDTARGLNSGGYGGIWHTGKTDFDAVTGPDEKKEGMDGGFDYTFLNEDTRRWLWRMGNCFERCLNVMTYAGYPNALNEGGSKDGLTRETAYNATGMNFLYNKKQYYINPPLPDGGLRMPPDFRATGQVYILRHGNGAEYSKVQITSFTRIYSPQSDKYKITWKTFDEE